MTTNGQLTTDHGPRTTYATVCSGIEAMSLAARGLEWVPLWFSEISPFPCAYLAHHYPEISNHGDMRLLADRVRSGAIPAPDVLAGGTPCQAFSISGLRAGLADERGQLTLAFVQFADAADAVRHEHGRPPCTILWENVPGVLSSKDNAFGCFLGGLAGEDLPLEPPGGKWTDAGYVLGPRRAVAWRVLDAQYFGLAQRRRRVWVVASARDDFDPGAVLFESEGLRRDTPPRREAQQDPAGTLAARPGAGGFPGTDESLDGYVVPTLTSMCGEQTGRDRESFAVVQAFGGGAIGGATDVAVPLVASPHGNRSDFETETLLVHGYEETTIYGPPFSRAGNSRAEESGAYVVESRHRVRRLMPIECERLQGHPDNSTLIPYRGRPAESCPDGPRYTALGNSWAVNNAAWILRRLDSALSHKSHPSHKPHSPSI